MKKIFLLLSSISFICLNAQVWETSLLKENPNANFLEKEAAFEEYKNQVKYTKGNGYKPYARSLDFILQRSSSGRDYQMNNFIENGLRKKKG